ncbi:MAG: response regulator [Planctomycetaceae bacterium]
MTAVLVVDDCLTDRRRAGGLLSRAGCDIVVAENGREALERIAGQRFDAVVTDLHMPEMDGLALVTSIVRDYPLVPVVVMTSLGSESTAVQALQAGAASYVPKRDLAAQLVETVKRVCLAAGETREFARLTERIARQAVRYELEPDLSLVPLAVRAIRELLPGRQALTEAEALRVTIAFEEALLNAIYHGNLEISSDLREDDPNAYYDLARARSELEPYCHRRVHVDVVVSREEVQFTISDDGPGFDPAALPDPTDPTNIARASGRGLLLIRTFMDEIVHNARGNAIRMVKRFTPCRVENDASRLLGVAEPEHAT